MTEIVLVLFIKIGFGTAAVTIDMPNMPICIREGKRADKMNSISGYICINRRADD